MSLDLAAILAAKDLKVELLAIPEWGGEVYIRVLTGAERDALEAEFTANKGKPSANFRARFAALVLCNAEGERLCTDKRANELAVKSSVALDRILTAGMALNAFTESEASTLLGESESALSGASGSSSP